MNRCWQKLTMVVILLFYISLSVVGQQDSTNLIINNIDSLRIAKIEHKNYRIMPYLAPAYTPETEYLLTAGGLITFKTQRWNNLLNRSSIPFSFGYSSTGAISVNIQNVIYLTDDKIRMLGEFLYKDMPDNYWGVGYDNGINIEKSPANTGYQRIYWRFFEKFMFRTFSDLFIGAVVDMNGTEATQLNARMLTDEYVLSNGTGINNTGIGLAVEYDTRDFVQNAYKGVFLSASMVFFQSYLGGNTKFKALEVDYRQYLKIKRERRTLAWNVKSRFSFGDEVPWTDMAMLGGPFNMRGYTIGRFRDQNALSMTTEYRHMFKRRTLNKRGNYNSRLGYVAWLGAGTVSHSINEFNGWLPNGGLGLRLELQTRMNMRFDYGVGKGEAGAYVTFSEAF
ncbi:BamA/TamA family outer membrane protein [Marinilabiliaceae bacterium A049]|nr:BamA/TamA family outer membrane protein [Marinilabiliaceae bacterium A049]